MSNELRVTLVQCELVWENPEANLKAIRALLEEEAPQTDVILLPEMFTTGFTMNANGLAQTFNGSALKWLTSVAKDFGCLVVGSLVYQDSGRYYNRLLAVNDEGLINHYDKRHLFTFAKENNHYTPGDQRVIVQYKGWRICPLICYDLRFPVWSRNADITGGDETNVYDLLVYVANWPEARRKPWINLLEARAHENQCFVVGVNRVGIDGNQIAYSGDSAAYTPKGELLSSIEPHKVQIQTVGLNRSDLDSFRDKFPVGRDKDTFQIH